MRIFTGSINGVWELMDDLDQSFPFLVIGTGGRTTVVVLDDENRKRTVEVSWTTPNGDVPEFKSFPANSSGFQKAFDLAHQITKVPIPMDLQQSFIEGEKE